MQNIKILEGYSDLEKGAYLGAIASIATADRNASQEELTYLSALCEAASLSQNQARVINEAATSTMADEDLKRCLDVLKTSELRFSLISDVIAFAKSDNTYSEEEQHSVQMIADYLGINEKQFSLLDQFTKKAVEEAPKQAEAFESDQTNPSSFLDSLGFGDKLKSAGINSNALVKGAIGIIGPILLLKMLSGGRNRGAMGGGFLGGLMGGGGMGGGLLGSLLGGGLLGSLLGGGRGFGSAGNMLGRLFGGGRRGW